MAVIVSDTAPLNYLVLIEGVDVLPRLYRRVLVPSAVSEELTRPQTPEPVRLLLAKQHHWLDVVAPSLPPDPTLGHLDAGESQAIALALERRADLLLLDERDGAIAARARGLDVTGTLGVLDRAADYGWLDLADMFARLRLTTFRCPVRLMEIMLQQDALRKQGRRT
jgi:predicted nucleic acid-binding protein